MTEGESAPAAASEHDSQNPESGSRNLVMRVIAALILASALLLRAQPGGLMSGYSKLAMLLFVIATALGLGLVISALFHDRKAKPPEERGPRG